MAIKPFETQDGIRVQSDDDILNSGGNSAFDGSGDAGISYKGFKAVYARMYDSEPTISKLLIFQDTASPTTQVDTETSDDLFKVSGLANSSIIALVNIYGADSQNPTPLSTLKQFVRSVVDNVILLNGEEGTLQSANNMKSNFYSNFDKLASQAGDRYQDFKFTREEWLDVPSTGGSGTGARFNIYRNRYDDSLETPEIFEPGSGYQVNNVVTVLGTVLGGTSPANDIVFTVTQVGAGGLIEDFTYTGTAPNNLFPLDNIEDGGTDQYDRANYIFTNILGDSWIANNNEEPVTRGAWALDYNNGDVADGAVWFGAGSEYVTTYNSSIFGLFITGANINWISTNGNSGFDGDGVADTGSLQLVFTDKLNNGNQTLTLNDDGSLTFPDGTIQTTAYTGQTGGGVSDASNVWVQTFESTDANDVVACAVSVEYDAAGNIIALFVHGSGTEPYTSYYSVGKYTTTGTRIWTARFADEFNTDGWGLAVDQSNGYIYIAGKMNTEGGQYNSTLTKISGTDGSIEWSKKYDFGSNSASNVVDVASDGNPVMVGYAESEGGKYVATTKIDAFDGTVIWSRGLDGQGDENALGMAVGPNGEVVAIGYMDQLGYEGDTADHMLVAKYNSAGAIQWQKAILFDEGFDCAGADADIDSNGNIYVVGQYQRDLNPGTVSAMSIVKFNSSGVKQWSRRVIGDCQTFGSSIVVGPDDKLYLSGMTFNNNAGDFIWVTAKYDFDGLVEWQRLIDNTSAWSFNGNFISGPDGVGGSNIAVKDGYVALGGGFGNLANSEQPHATVLQVNASGDLFTVGSWDFKQANFSGTLNSSASDITVVDADKDDYDNILQIDTGTVSLDFDTSNFLIGTLYSTAVVDNTVGFTVLADGTLAAVAGVIDSTVLTDSLQSGRPDWLVITPRSPDRDELGTDYGFDGSGMWFIGDNEATSIEQPAYPIHTRDAIPADVKVVVEFDVSLQSGFEDWGICVYPANGVPHWAWDPHPSRIAAMIDCSDDSVRAQAEIHGFNNSKYGVDTTDVARARFTYDPVAELTTFELLDNGRVTSRAQLPGRLARNQDYMIGFDGDWDEAGPGDKSYFTNLTITTSASAIKSTEFTVSGEVKLPSTVKGFVNMQGPWSNNEDGIIFQSVATHDGFAYMIGENSWNENNRVRIDKYSLTSGELVWTRVLGAGRNAQFNISWTGGVYTIDNINNGGQGYQAGELLYIPGWRFGGGNAVLNRATITVLTVNQTGGISTASIAGTAPSGTDVANNVDENYEDANGYPNSVKYDTVTDTLVVLTEQNALVGDVDDETWSRALVVRINPVSGDVVSTVTLSDEGDIYPFDVAVHPTTGATAVAGQKFNEYRNFGTLTMLAKGNGYFDILKSNLDEEHWPGNQLPGEYASDFWIQGTGIANKENVDNVNYYENISTTGGQGSGLTVDILVDPITGSRMANANNQGSNYVVNDVVIIPGTAFANGATPANDVEVTVVSVGGSGNVTSVVTAGVTPTNAIRIQVNGVDFTGAGSWTMKQNLGGEAFVWTPNWNKAIGGPTYDRFQSVVYSKDGNSIYAVGDGRYEVDYSQSLVVKFDAFNGDINFSKYLNSDTEDAYATGVATIGASDIVVSGFEYSTVNGLNRHQQFVARLGSSGNIIWKKFYSDSSWNNAIDTPSDVQVDSDDNIYITMQMGPNVFNWSSTGFTVTKLDKDGNLLWSRCVNGNESSYLSDNNGNRQSSLHGNQLVVVGYTYETADDYYNGLWASIPTDGFAYFGGEGDFIQMGAFRLSQGRISTGPELGGGASSFTPSNQAPNISETTNLKNYTTRTTANRFPQHLHKMVDPTHGGLVFGDGSRQITAADRIPQIRADNDYHVTVNDSGKHIYFKNNDGTVVIPNEYILDLPVGFTFTIVNCTGNDCYVRLDSGNSERGTILGAGRNISTYVWGIPDSGSGSMVTLIKLESGFDFGGGSTGPVWMISGPGDIYNDD
jgi:hypothetical protein